jgi:ankyrin repeat protein
MRLKAMTSESTTLLSALLECDEEKALYCLDAGVDPNAGMVGGCKAIHLAATNMSPRFLRRLISAGADIKAQDQYFGQTALHMACNRWQDSLEIIQILLDAGADPSIVDGNGYSLSDHAMMVEVNQEFAARNIGIDSRSEDRYPFQFDKKHAQFLLAAKEGDCDLLKAEFQVDMPDKIKTLALHETLNRGRYDCCRLLLDSGIDPNARGITGFTPLAVAAANLEIAIADMLISYGADRNKKTSGGQTPLSLAGVAVNEDFPEKMVHRKLQEMMSLLRQSMRR